MSTKINVEDQAALEEEVNLWPEYQACLNLNKKPLDQKPENLAVVSEKPAMDEESKQEEGVIQRKKDKKSTDQP